MSCPKFWIFTSHMKSIRLSSYSPEPHPFCLFPIARVRISSFKHAADVLLAASLILKRSDTKRNRSSVSKGACHIHNGHQGIRKSSTQNRCSQANFLTHFAHWFWQVAWNIKKKMGIAGYQHKSHRLLVYCITITNCSATNQQIIVFNNAFSHNDLHLFFFFSKPNN